MASCPESEPAGVQTRGYLVEVEACERLFYFIAHAPELLIDIFGGALGLRRVVKADVQTFPDIAGKCWAVPVGMAAYGYDIVPRVVPVAAYVGGGCGDRCRCRPRP